MRWKLLIILLAVFCLQQGNRLVTKLRPAQLQLTFFDVGQGDAALITTPNNKHFLIDTGVWQPDYNSATYVIIPHLKERGIERLNGVFLTHPHADHIGGILKLIESIPIDTIYNSGSSHDSNLYNAYHQKAAQKQIPVVSLSAGDKVTVDPATRLFVYGPASLMDANVNNSSLIVELIYGQTEFLFLGDAEHRQEQRLLQNFPELVDTDFLKVSHHGSKTSSTSSLLQKATPQFGLISLSKSNRFGHPHKEATRRIGKNIPRIYFTSLTGAVHFTSNGKEIYQNF